MKSIDISTKTYPNTFALVDDADFDLVNQYNWYARKKGNTFYAQANARKPDSTWTILQMHRLILNPPDSLQTDHKDSNGLNNQRYNLRACTHSQNQYNRLLQGGSSKFKGVSWYKLTKKWEAYIRNNGKKQSLGHFTDETKAAKCYDEKALELFGEFARLNFPMQISLIA